MPNSEQSDSGLAQAEKEQIAETGSEEEFDDGGQYADPYADGGYDGQWDDEAMRGVADGLGVGSGTDGTESEPEDEEDEAVPDDADDGTHEYTGGIANIIGNFASMFSGMPSIQKALYRVADWFESVHVSKESVGQEEEDPYAYAGDMMTDAYFDATGVDSQTFTDELGEAAQMLREDGSIGNGNAVGEFSDAVSSAAQSDPSVTASFMQNFNDTAMDHISRVYVEGTDEYDAAVSCLGTVMSSMTESYYGTVLGMEQSGTRMLSSEELEQINGLDLTGVNVSYGEYSPGMDVTVPVDDHEAAYDAHDALVEEGYNIRNGFQSEDDPEMLKASDGASYRYTSESEFLSMQDQADQMVSDGTFEGYGSEGLGADFSGGDTVGSRISEIRAVSAASDEADSAQISADGYMQLMADLQALNDEAVYDIGQQYADDPEAAQAATDGLGQFMRAVTEPAFDAMKADDEALGMFSEEQLQALDNMSLTGVNVSYSDYQSGMDMKTGAWAETAEEAEYRSDLKRMQEDADYYPAAERMTYASAGMGGDYGLDEYSGGTENGPFIGQDEDSAGRRSRQPQSDRPRRDRGKDAEQYFSRTLANVAEEEQVLQDDEEEPDGYPV